MKKLKDFEGQKIAVNCTTQEQAEAFCKLMHDNGLKWFNGDYYFPYTLWDRYKQSTCYDFNKGQFMDLQYYTEEDYTILPATDFLEEEFIYGQEYEFSDCEDFKITRIALYGCENPINKDCYKYVVFLKEGGTPFTFKYCRKINTERTEAITTAKELITKFYIKKDELY